MITSDRRRKARILELAQTRPAPVVRLAMKKVLEPKMKMGKRRRAQIKEAVRAARRR